MLLTNLFLLLVFTQPQINKPIYITDKPIIIENVIKNSTYEEIDPFIDDLYYQDKKIRIIGKNNLLRIAQESYLSRKAVIEALIRVLNDKRLLTYQKEFRYQTWYDAANLLGELHAVEALDLLINHLDYTVDKKDIFLNYYPVIEVVAKISQGSIVKLTKAVFEHKNWVIRINAVRALGIINSQEARKVLLKALSTEQNPEVQKQIQIELNRWSRGELFALGTNLSNKSIVMS